MAAPGAPQAVLIPPGNYTLTSTVDISSSYTVLRGAGVGQTNLYMPLGLEAPYGGATAWAFGGGFVGISGSNPASRLLQAVAAVTAPATRGDTRLYVSSTAPFTVGQWLLAAAAPAGSRKALATKMSGLFSNGWLQAAASAAAERDWDILPPGSLPAVPASAKMGARKPPKLLLAAAKYATAGAYSHWVNDQAEAVQVQPAATSAATVDVTAVARTLSAATAAEPFTLDAYLYGDNLVDSGTPTEMFPRNDRLRMPFKVTAVGDGWIELDCPLPIDLRLAWQPAVFPYAPTVQHSGIEDLTFQFRWDTYTDHLDSKGYNAVVHIIDCTSGVFTGGTEFVTMQNISFHVTKPRGTGNMATRGVDGHHAFMMSHGAYNVMSGWRLPQSRYYHDISVDALLHLSVVSAGSGLDINLDTHRAATHNNLFTNIDCGRMLRPWQSGGDALRGAYRGANTTWWGMYTTNANAAAPSLPACTSGAFLNWLGRFSSAALPGACPGTKWTVENSGASKWLLPRDLFAAQRAPARRLLRILTAGAATRRHLPLPPPRSISSAAMAAPQARAFREHSSQSNPEQAAVTHTDIELDVDFDTHVLSGYLEHTVEVKQDGVAELALDTRDVRVSGVAVNGTAAEFTLCEPSKALGTRLSVALPAGLKAGDVLRVSMRFEASPTASAVQWLAPEQTAGKQHPYLFTQCQAIHARSILPCQDTPGAKFTYAAAVRVPRALRALMSAVPQGEDGDGAELEHVGNKLTAGTKVWRFKQAVPIPSYLLALAVGNLESRRLGPISSVWSEPEMVEAGAYEFAETDKFLQAAADLAGPYQWGVYDVLLLPPSFPYGGMENPCLTFVTPTLLAGDRSLANVVAHEIAHSWTGNLVTNRSWEHFWLNEGFTVYLERKIMGRLYGEQRYQFQASQGWLKLQDAVRKQFSEAHPFTCLVPDLSGGVDPDDAFSSIPYEKGFAFIHYLQELVGGSAKFEPFFRQYVQTFAGTPLTSDDFKAFFLDYFKGEEKVKEIEWETWFYKPGMPPVTNKYDESLGQQAYELAKKWHTSDVMGIGSDGPAGASADDIKGWSSTQIVAFLDKLGELRSMQPLHPTITRKMDELYDLDASHNSEIRSSWLKLCIDAGDEATLPHAKAFLSEQGRMKFLRPLYRALHGSKSEKARQLAKETYEANRSAYHPIAAKLVAADLKLAEAA
ncbi:Leukotriene A-4 hydrolase isoform A [Micractinium conductrix]|uniref:Leucine aminopeptidase n=1 Tax=Micractinium conductrix TaxID=554055 RepID=A0A2P6V8H5_9CHLO|nr:Leukotriene A-4 hydrolase isoform A [Micractinium conductrix]|eukprot:PSC70392.1 Leukotriene A-4 hydrolase isoform A [Micractinium conductrix]